MLNEVIKIAREAGEILLNYYQNSSIIVTEKENKSPVTEADIASNTFITKALEKCFSFPVLAEEGVIKYEERQSWDTFWLVDPLDGTKDFLAKNDEFTINIALIKKGVPVLGVLYAPAREEMYFTEIGKGAFLSSAGETVRLPRTKCEGLVAVKSRFHETLMTKKFLEVNTILKNISVGSALKFGKLAEGVANIYPRYTGSMEWDIAAGHILLKETGCQLLTLGNMKEPGYNKPSLKNDFFIAFSDQIKLEELQFVDPTDS